MANVTVTVDFDELAGNISVTKGQQAVTMNINTLSSLLKPGTTWQDAAAPGRTVADQFKYEQEYINYLDTIKDGKIVNSKVSSLEQGILLGQITVTPDHAGNTMYGNLAAAGPPAYPHDLGTLENAVEQYAYTLGLIEKSSGLPKSTVKASLASKLAIDSVFHDAGRGPETYCVPGYNMVNNIAQYIDPATDMHFDEVYPPRNSTISFAPSFMHLFGLGGTPGGVFTSSIEATATNLTTFRYDIHCYGHQFSLLQGALGDPFRWVSRPRGPPASAKPEAIFTGNPEKNRDREPNSNVLGSWCNAEHRGKRFSI